MKRFINTAPLVLDRHTPIKEAILAVPFSYSQIILSRDSQGLITGVVSLSDLLIAEASNQRQQLFEIESKPIQFLRLEHLSKDLKHSAIKFNRSYLPVVTAGSDISERNLVGVFDMKDFAKYLIRTVPIKRLESFLT